MYELFQQFFMEFTCAVLVAAIIALEHLFCYRKHLIPVVRYTLGVIAFAVPFSLVVRDTYTLIVLWSYILIAGFVTLLLHMWRLRRHEWHGEAEAQYQSGLTTGLAEEQERGDGTTGKR